MDSVLKAKNSLMHTFAVKMQDFCNEIDNVHMVWLKEIQQEADRMFSSDFSAEPELMPRTPSQKKYNRRKRVSTARQDEGPARRFSKRRCSNASSALQTRQLFKEEENVSDDMDSKPSTSTQSKRPPRKTKRTKTALDESQSQVVSPSVGFQSKEVENKQPELNPDEHQACESKPDPKADEIPAPEVIVVISPKDRLSAELNKKPEPSPGRTAAKIPIAGKGRASRRSSVRHSLKLRHSMAGLRHSRTQENLCRASRQSVAKKKAARMGNSTCSSNISEDSCIESTEEEEEAAAAAAAAEEEEEEEVEAVLESPPKDTLDVPPKSPEKSPEIIQSASPPALRITRSVAANSPLRTPSSFPLKQKALPAIETLVASEEQEVRRSNRSTKRKAPETVEGSPHKKLSPPKKSHSAIRPNMRSFLHTVQKNQMLMMTPNSYGHANTIKSFIKHTTPLKVDTKAKERYKLEALKKKQEQEEERMRKMEEEKKKKQEEMKRKRDERLKRVIEAKVKEEQKKEEKNKRIEQKMVKIDEKNDKRVAEERVKKKVAQKRQEELELKKKLEEEAKRKKIQQAEEEKRQQELLAKKKAEEEEQARKLAEARRAQELEKERHEKERHEKERQEKERQERERQERERQAAAAERMRMEREKVLALQQELEKAAREKEKRELEEKKKALEQKRKLEEQQRMAEKEKEVAAALKAPPTVTIRWSGRRRQSSWRRSSPSALLNVTMDYEPTSPQSYVISPKGGSKPLSKHLEDYGMDQNSDDSTDDESAPRKPIPSWAEGQNLQHLLLKQYYNPPELDSFFGPIKPPKLEDIFYKSKPRYFKRTSSAVWHSPLAGAK